MLLTLITRCDPDTEARWQAALDAALRARLPQATWLPPARLAEADVALVANPPPGALRQARGLRLIQSLWAGVDGLLADPTLPDGVPIARMVDPAMTAAMAETATWAVTALQRDFFTYARQQAQGVWREWPQRRADECPVLLLGLGEMGREVARRLATAGHPVGAWRRSAGADAPAGVTVWHGEAGLHEALARHRVVVNLLPLTPDTRGLLDAARLSRLPEGAGLVNLGRGATVVEADLLRALDDGPLGHAVLDVFHVEPLPADHPFWRHPRVTVLPHVAAQTDLRTAARVVADNLVALRDGRPLAHRVDRGRGY
jgi:glyoxylate/hydroxypyruvate reductase